MAEKSYSQYLVLDWKTGASRTRKSKPGPSDLGANELLAELDVSVTVPEVEVPTLAVEIDVPEPQVHQATLEALDDDDMPDWTGAAEDAIDHYHARIKSLDGPSQIEDMVNILTTRTLKNAPGRPPLSAVREYLFERVDALMAEAEREAADG